MDIMIAKNKNESVFKDVYVIEILTSYQYSEETYRVICQNESKYKKNIIEFLFFYHFEALQRRYDGGFFKLFRPSKGYFNFLADYPKVGDEWKSYYIPDKFQYYFYDKNGDEFNVSYSQTVEDDVINLCTEFLQKENKTKQDGKNFVSVAISYIDKIILEDTIAKKDLTDKLPELIKI